MGGKKKKRNNKKNNGNGKKMSLNASLSKAMAVDASVGAPLTRSKSKKLAVMDNDSGEVFSVYSLAFVLYSEPSLSL